MLAHAGGAATLDAPTWLLAYGAAALVLLTTVARRGTLVAAAARPAVDATGRDHEDDEVGGSSRSRRVGRSGRLSATARFVGRALGIGALTVVVAAALAGPDGPAANLAPSAALVVWWVGLPLACLLAGDVMRWLDPFGTLTTALPIERVVPVEAGGPGGLRVPGERVVPVVPVGPEWTAAAALAAFAWWVLAFHDARSPRPLGSFLVVYSACAALGAARWGPGWLRRGEGFGALSAALAAARRPGGQGAEPLSDSGLAALVSVWLGAVVFDLFSGSRAWVELAGSSSGWARTGRATACLAVAVALAWTVLAASRRLAAGRAARAAGRADRAAGAVAGGAAGAADRADGTERDRRRRAVTVAWLCVTAGAFLAHGITLLVVDGQFALALVSDPFGRGWDLFGTARRTVDYSPLSPGLLGTLQLVLAVGGGMWGVVAASREVRARPDRGALRALWVAGVGAAVAVALFVATMATDLE